MRAARRIDPVDRPQHRQPGHLADVLVLDAPPAGVPHGVLDDPFVSSHDLVARPQIAGRPVLAQAIDHGGAAETTR